MEDIKVTRLDGIDIDEKFEQDKKWKKINSREEASGQLFFLETYRIVLK